MTAASDGYHATRALVVPGPTPQQAFTQPAQRVCELPCAVMQLSRAPRPFEAHMRVPMRAPSVRFIMASPFTAPANVTCTVSTASRKYAGIELYHVRRGRAWRRISKWDLVHVARLGITIADAESWRSSSLKAHQKQHISSQRLTSFTYAFNEPRRDGTQDVKPSPEERAQQRQFLTCHPGLCHASPRAILRREDVGQELIAVAIVVLTVVAGSCSVHHVVEEAATAPGIAAHAEQGSQKCARRVGAPGSERTRRMLIEAGAGVRGGARR